MTVPLNVSVGVALIENAATASSKYFEDELLGPFFYLSSSPHAVNMVKVVISATISDKIFFIENKF